MTDKLRSPSPESERGRGEGTPMQDMARGRERTPSPRLRGEGWGEGPGEFAPPAPHPLGGACPWACRRQDPRGESASPRLAGRGVSRRAFLAGTAALAALGPRRAALAATEAETESHGLSTFGELKYPADFKHFDYVNPEAPKGGTLALQIKRGAGNQNFDTFNTLNVFVLKGDGAAGMDATFDSLMAGSGDEPGRALRPPRPQGALVGRQAHLPLPAASRSAVPRRIAGDGAGRRLLDQHPEGQGPPELSLGAERGLGGRGRVRRRPQGPAVAETQPRPAPHRRRQLPVFSEAYWRDRDFEASTLEPPLGSGPYKVGRFEQGRFIEFDRVPDYWGRDLPVNLGQNNFDQRALRVFPRPAGRLRGVQVRRHQLPRGVHLPDLGDRLRLPGLPRGPRQARGHRPRRRRSDARLVLQHPPRDVQGPRASARRSGSPSISNGRTRTSCSASTTALHSFFENSDMKAVGPPAPEELALLEPFRGKVPDEVFGEPYVPPVSDGSGSDRNLLRRADALLREAGCKRDGTVLKLPDGKPFEIEFLDYQASLQPHTQPFQANLKRLGIEARSRIVDAAQYQRRMEDFDFDMASMALGGAMTPGDALRIVFSSEAAATPGSRNIAGIADPAVDALIGEIAQADSRAKLNVAPRARPLLRAGATDPDVAARLAYWDMLGPRRWIRRAPGPGDDRSDRQLIGTMLSRAPERSATPTSYDGSGAPARPASVPYASPRGQDAVRDCDTAASPRSPAPSVERPDGMPAYIARRVLLMIPTLFGIMLFSFIIVQFAPGGPVERIIAQLQGNDSGASARISGGGRRPRGRRRGAAQGTAARTRRRRATAARRGSTRSSSSSSRSSSASTSRRIERFCQDDVGLRPLRFRQELFPRRLGAAADPREAAGVDLARPVDDAAVLRDLDPARHPQGGADGSALRHLDLGRRHRRLRHPGLPVRDPAHRALRRRLVLADSSRCAA